MFHLLFSEFYSFVDDDCTMNLFLDYKTQQEMFDFSHKFSHLTFVSGFGSKDFPHKNQISNSKIVFVTILK